MFASPPGSAGRLLLVGLFAGENDENCTSAWDVNLIRSLLSCTKNTPAYVPLDQSSFTAPSLHHAGEVQPLIAAITENTPSTSAKTPNRNTRVARVKSGRERAKIHE